MKRPLALGFFVVLFAVLHVVLCSTAVGAPYVQSPFVQSPFVQSPFVQSPFVQSPFSGNRCNPGYSYTRYQNQGKCIKCNPGYSYTRYQNQDKCIK